MVTNKFTLICDDVRREDNGKLIIIGIYTGVVLVPQLPLVMPAGLTFFQGWESDRPGPVDLKIKLQHLETGRVLIEARGGMNLPGVGLMHAPLRLGPLQFQAFGAYTLSMEIEGQKEPVTVDFSVQLHVPQVPQRT
jgi:hypothetical protein